MTAREKVNSLNQQGKFICVGLDTDINKIPMYLLQEKNPILKFNRLIIEATKDLAAAYKINFAFYEKNGIKGIEELEKTIELIPGSILSIADAKRCVYGDDICHFCSLRHAGRKYQHLCGKFTENHWAASAVICRAFCTAGCQTGRNRAVNRPLIRIKQRLHPARNLW